MGIAWAAEQGRILRLLIAPDGISVPLHAAGIRSLVTELVGAEAAAPEPRHAPVLEAVEIMGDHTSHEIETLTIRIPIRLQRRGGRKLIMTPEGVATPARKPNRDEILIKALVRAHRWRRKIDIVRRSR